jgi:hypothetical protein
MSFSPEVLVDKSKQRSTICVIFVWKQMQNKNILLSERGTLLFMCGAVIDNSMGTQ